MDTGDSNRFLKGDSCYRVTFPGSVACEKGPVEGFTTEARSSRRGSEPEMDLGVNCSLFSASRWCGEERFVVWEAGLVKRSACVR